MSEQVEKETKKSLPRWLVLAVVVATGGITAAAMFATGLRGPSIAWDRASKGVESVWPGETAATAMPVQGATAQPVQPVQPMQQAPMAQPVQPATQPMASAMNPVMPVAALPGVPT